MTRRSIIAVSILDISDAGTAAQKNMRTDFKSLNQSELLPLNHAISISRIWSGTGRDVATPSLLPVNAVSFCYSVGGDPDCAGLGDQAGSILDYSSMGSTYRTQFFSTYRSSNLYFRTQNGDNKGEWNPWQRIYHTGYKPLPSDIGSPTFLGDIAFGGSSGLWTTTEFLNFLRGQGILSTATNGHWICRGSWSYGSNKTISDTSTGCGNIPLAGSLVEVVGADGFCTIRITTPTTFSSLGGDAFGGGKSTYVYIQNSKTGDYYPGWRRDYNTSNPPNANEVGAYPTNAITATPYPPGGVPWNAPTGMYYEQILNEQGNQTATNLLLQFFAHPTTGSCRAAQFRINYHNGGLFYRSSRDGYGFEDPFTKIYTEKHLPTLTELNAVSASGGDYNSVYRLGQVSTLPNDSNGAGLFSTAVGSPVGTWANHTWYEYHDYKVYTGIVRGANNALECYRVSVNNSTGSQGQFDFRLTGDFEASRNGYFNDVYIRSDIRDKRNIKFISNPLSKLQKLHGAIYEVKSPSGYSHSGGLIAQEILDAIPELVTVDKNFEGKDRYRVNYNGVIGLLVNGINKLASQHNKLTKEVSDLKKLLSVC